VIHKLLLLTRENDQYRQLLAEQSLPNLEIVDDSTDHMTEYMTDHNGVYTTSNINEADIWLAEPHLAASYCNIQ
jgi:hypothetical protein